MPYLLSEIAGYLVFAWLVGLLTGWALNRCNCRKEINQRQMQLEEAEGTVIEKESALARSNEQITSIQSELTSIKQELAEAQTRHTQMREALIRLNGKRDQLSQWATLFQSKYLEQKTATNQALDEHAAAEASWLEQADGLRQQVAQLSQDLADKSAEATIEEQWQARIDELHHQISSANQKLADQQQEIAELTSTNIALQNKQAESNSERLYTDVEAPDNRFFRLVDQIRLLGTSKKDIVGRLQNQNRELRDNHDAHAAEFVKTCEQKDQIIQDLQTELRRANNRLQQKAQDQVDRDRISVLENELKAYEQKIKDAKAVEAQSTEQKLTIEAYRTKLERKEEEIALLQTSPQPDSSLKKKPKETPAKPAKAKASNSKPSVTDDLKRIKGIGPKLEGLLHKQGITNFAQVSRLTDSDIEDLSELLGNFKDRIVRDDWVGKARALHVEKYGEDPS